MMYRLTRHPDRPAAAQPACAHGRRVDHLVHGFTLVELLVVIAIATLVIGVSVPVLNILVETVRGTTGQTTVSTAIHAARLLSSRASGGVSTVTTDDGTNIEYEGTALIFCPDQTIRFVVHNPGARNNTNATLDDDDFIWSHDVLENGPSPGHYDYTAGGDGVQDRALGFEDVEDADYLRVSASTGIVGIPVQGSQSELVAPPFAIRFNASGQLGLDRPFLFYDGDYDGIYDVRITRENGGSGSHYNDESGGSSDEYEYGIDSLIFETGDINAMRVPFEKIPTAVGLYLFELSAYRDAGYDFPVDTAEELAWFRVNAYRTKLARRGIAREDMGNRNGGDIDVDGTDVAVNDVPRANVTLMQFSPNSGLILKD